MSLIHLALLCENLNCVRINVAHSINLYWTLLIRKHVDIHFQEVSLYLINISQSPLFL